MYEDDFEVFDVVNGPCDRGVYAAALREHVVYIEKKRYDAEVRRGQEQIAAAYAQLALDMPRGSFYVNGYRATRPTGTIPLELVRFCTQAVLAFPIELLMRDERVLVVSESGEPMQVNVTHKTVNVRKTMKVWFQNNRFVDVHIWVSASRDNPIAQISFVFGPCKMTSMASS